MREPPPGQNGIALIRELRRQESTRSLPIVVVSARVDQARQDLHGDAFGVIDWLGKPVDHMRLLDAVKLGSHHSLSRQLPRVLYVEDNPDDIKQVSELLRNRADITSTSNIEDAKFRLAREAFDLVILDLLLPDGFGMQLLPYLKDTHGRAICAGRMN